MNIEHRLEGLEARLSSIETLLRQKTVEPESVPAHHPAPAAAAPIASQMTAPVTDPRGAIWVPPSAAGPATIQRPQAAATGASIVRPKPATPAGSSNVLGALAILCFFLAAAYFVKLAIDNGWLTPGRQCILASLFGFSLIAAGFRIRDKDKSYATFLPAAGIVIQFLAIIGAVSVFGLISAEFAIILLWMNSVLCVWLARQFTPLPYLLIGGIGGYAIPLMFSALSNDVLVTYIVILGLTYSLLSVWFEERGLNLLSGFLSIGFISVLSLKRISPETAASVMLILFLVHLGNIVLVSWLKKQPLTRGEAVPYFPLALFFYGVEYQMLNLITPDFVHWIAVLFALSLIGIQEAASRGLNLPKDSPSRDIAWSTALLILVHVGYVRILPDAFHPAIAIATIFAMGVPQIRRAGQSSIAQLPLVSQILKILGILFIAGQYLMVLTQVVANNTEWQWPIFGMGFALAMLFVYLTQLVVRTVEMSAPLQDWQSTVKSTNSIRDLKYVILGLAHVQAVASLYAWASDIGSLAVSASWMAYAIFLMTLGFQRRDAIVGKSCLYVLLLAAGKALLYDVSNSPGPVRILCLLLTGGVLYGAGYLFRRMNEWPASEPTASPTAATSL